MTMLPPLLAPEPSSSETARSRKKLETRLALQDAALELFVQQGYEATTVDQIAARAKVSPATFFRHFESKSEVIFNDPDRGLPALWQAIIDRPQSDSDLVAIGEAIRTAWATRVDPERAARQARAVAGSPVLRGLSEELGRRWQSIIADALARRKRLAVADHHCELTAAIALTVFGKALETWLSEQPRGELAAAIDREFDLARKLCEHWVQAGTDETERQ